MTYLLNECKKANQNAIAARERKLNEETKKLDNLINNYIIYIKENCLEDMVEILKCWEEIEPYPARSIEHGVINTVKFADIEILKTFDDRNMIFRFGGVNSSNTKKAWLTVNKNYKIKLNYKVKDERGIFQKLEEDFDEIKNADKELMLDILRIFVDKFPKAKDKYYEFIYNKIRSLIEEAEEN